MHFTGEKGENSLVSHHMHNWVDLHYVIALHYMQMFKVASVDNFKDTPPWREKPKANYKIMFGYDCRNTCVFSLRQNIDSDGAVVMSSG